MPAEINSLLHMKSDTSITGVQALTPLSVLLLPARNNRAGSIGLHITHTASQRMSPAPRDAGQSCGGCRTDGARVRITSRASPYSTVAAQPSKALSFFEEMWVQDLNLGSPSTMVVRCPREPWEIMWPQILVRSADKL